MLLDALGTSEDVGAKIVLDAVSSLAPGPELERYFAALDRAEQASRSRVANMLATLRNAVALRGGPAPDASSPAVKGRWAVHEFVDDGDPGNPLVAIGYRVGTIVQSGNAERDADTWEGLQAMLLERFGIYLIALRRDTAGTPRDYNLGALPPNNLGPINSYGAAPAIIAAAPPPPERTDLWLSRVISLRQDEAYDVAQIEQAAAELTAAARASGVLRPIAE